MVNEVARFFLIKKSKFFTIFIEKFPPHHYMYCEDIEKGIMMKKVILSLVIGGLSISGNCFANPLEAVKDKCDIAYHKVQDGARKVKNSAYKILKKPATKKVLAIGAVAGTGAAAYIFAPNIVKKGAKVVADKGLDALNGVKEYFGYAQKVQPVVVPEVVSWNPLHKVNGILEQIKNGVYSVLGICASIGAGYGGYKIYQNFEGASADTKTANGGDNPEDDASKKKNYPGANNNGVTPQGENSVINEVDPNATNNGEKPENNN